MEDIAAFCATVDEASADRLPAPLRANLMVLSAWWSVPLYVRLSNVLEAPTFDDAVWARASEVLCGSMAGDVLPGIAGDSQEQAALSAALANHIKGVCKLWTAAFGSPATAERFRDVAHTSAELQALFTNDTLGLQESFGLSGSDGTEAGPETLTAFCNAFAGYFDVCVKALPQD